MESNADREEMGQLKKIGGRRSGSMSMVEDLEKRKRDEIGGIGGEWEGGIICLTYFRRAERRKDLDMKGGEEKKEKRN